VLWAAFTLSFVLLQVLPGDAVLIKFQNRISGSARRKSPRCAWPTAPTARCGSSISTRCGDAAGDFGYSLQAGIAVSELIASNLPDTLSLALPAFILAVALAFAWPSPRLPGLRWLSNTFSLCRCCLSRCRPSGWGLP
jgi:peptide/nickel transport system permease protein